MAKELKWRRSVAKWCAFGVQQKILNGSAELESTVLCCRLLIYVATDQKLNNFFLFPLSLSSDQVDLVVGLSRGRRQHATKTTHSNNITTETRKMKPIIEQRQKA